MADTKFVFLILLHKLDKDSFYVRGSETFQTKQIESLPFLRYYKDSHGVVAVSQKYQNI